MILRFNRINDQTALYSQVSIANEFHRSILDAIGIGPNFAHLVAGQYIRG